MSEHLRLDGDAAGTRKNKHLWDAGRGEELFWAGWAWLRPLLILQTRAVTRFWGRLVTNLCDEIQNYRTTNNHHTAYISLQQVNKLFSNVLMYVIRTNNTKRTAAGKMIIII